jgi:hypothetical protein
MWSLFNCYLSGRHDYGMWCEPGAIFLRCVHCGKRSSGWAMDVKASNSAPRPKPAEAHAAVVTPPVPSNARVLPFARAATRQDGRISDHGRHRLHSANGNIATR